MRKVAFLLLAMVAVGCSSEAQRGSVAQIGEPGVTVAQARAFDELQADTASSWTWMQHETFATPSHLAGSRTGTALLVAGTPAAQTTIAFVDRYRDLFKMTDAAAELRLSKSSVDERSYTHVRFQQVTHGIPVVGAELSAHYDAEGRLTSIDANYVPDVSGVDVDPAISVTAAHDIAIADIVATTDGVDASKLQASSGKLVVVANGARPAALAFEYTVRAIFGSEPAIWVVRVDAKTGAILHRYNNLQTIEATGTGVLGDSKKFQVTQSGGSYAMLDTSRGVSISTYDASSQEIGPAQGASEVTSTSLTAWDQSAPGPGAAVDAHVYAGVVFDYYKTVHARNAIDGAGGEMLSTAHFGQAYDNAFWDGTGMSYGDGGQLFKPLSAALDVVAHEFTHGVTQAESGLDYEGQSGALNESVSDIFGAFIEHSLRPDDTKNWIMGESIAKSGPGLRDFKKPSNGQQPGNMSVYVNTQQDNGGVHINSGIPNNAAYLMTMGGTNPISKVVVAAGIGWEKSEKLWYRANTKYFMTKTNFAQAAQGVMQAAKDIGLTDNEQNIVDCAWKAVGVVQGTCNPIVDPNAPTPPPAPTTTDPTGSATPDDPAADEGPPTATPARRTTLAAPQASSGCNVGPHGADFGPLAGLLAAVLGLAAASRRRKR